MPPATVDSAEVLAHQRVNDPDFWVAVVCWALIVFSCLQVLLFSFGRDQSIYAMVGDGILQGRMPYGSLGLQAAGRLPRLRAGAGGVRQDDGRRPAARGGGLLGVAFATDASRSSRSSSGA
jgi:hypothetical protein